VTVPLAATLVGVILPRPIAMVPLVVIGLPLIETPWEPLAATDVTVPDARGITGPAFTWNPSKLAFVSDRLPTLPVVVLYNPATGDTAVARFSIV
jgi:hypothetical protein